MKFKKGQITKSVYDVIMHDLESLNIDLSLDDNKYHYDLLKGNLNDLFGIKEKSSYHVGWGVVKMNILDAIEKLLNCADASTYKGNQPELKEASETVKDWINSPSCPLVNDSELEEEIKMNPKKKEVSVIKKSKKREIFNPNHLYKDNFGFYIYKHNSGYVRTLTKNRRKSVQIIKYNLSNK